MKPLQENLSDLISWGVTHQMSDILIEEGINQSIQGLCGQKRINYQFDYSIKHFIDYIIHTSKISLGQTIAQSEWIEVWTPLRFVSVRVSYLKTYHTRFITLRLIHHTTLQLDYIIPHQFQRDVKQITQIQDGLICFVGKAGSGKSTTLRSFLQSISERRIISIEHPIESHMSFMMQIEQHHYDIEHLVYHSLRHHPHVVVIEEVRNAHELRVAYETALSGHLVCITFHALDEIKAQQRMLAMYPTMDCSLIKAWFCQSKGENHDFQVSVSLTSQET